MAAESEVSGAPSQADPSKGPLNSGHDGAAQALESDSRSSTTAGGDQSSSPPEAKPAGDAAASPAQQPAERPAAAEHHRIPLEEKSASEIAVIVGALCLAVFLAALDMSIVSTALPSIAAEFHISQADYNWIGSAYLLACAASTPSWGKVSDIFGRKPILILANVVFLIGSLICALSINQRMLIGGRCIQGIGGGGLLSLVNICVADLFSQRARGTYYGWVGGTWAVAGALGPLLGGVFSEFVTWRWCFYINLPLDAIALLILFFFLKIDTPKTPLVKGLGAIDWLGLLTSVGGVVMFLIGLEFGGVSFPWSSATVLSLIIFGAVLFAVFLVIEWKVAKYPMMPLRLFTSKSRAFGFITNFCHGFSFIAGSYFLPLYFQAVLSATPFYAGVMQLAYIFALSFTVSFVGPIIKKWGDFKTPIVVGMFVMALGFGLFIYLPDHADYARIIPAQLLAGFGAGPNFQGPLIALQAHSEPADVATMTAAFSFSRLCAQAISLVIGGVIFQNRMAQQAGQLSGHVNATTLQEITGGSAGAGIHAVQQLPEPAKALVQTVFTNSLQVMWIFYTVIMVVGLAASLMISKKKLSDKHEMRKQGLEVEEKERKARLAEEASKNQTQAEDEKQV